MVQKSKKSADYFVVYEGEHFCNNFDGPGLTSNYTCDLISGLRGQQKDPLWTKAWAKNCLILLVVAELSSNNFQLQFTFLWHKNWKNETIERMNLCLWLLKMESYLSKNNLPSEATRWLKTENCWFFCRPEEEKNNNTLASSIKGNLIRRRGLLEERERGSLAPLLKKRLLLQ